MSPSRMFAVLIAMCYNRCYDAASCHVGFGQSFCCLTVVMLVSDMFIFLVNKNRGVLMPCFVTKCAFFVAHLLNVDCRNDGSIHIQSAMCTALCLMCNFYGVESFC